MTMKSHIFLEKKMTFTVGQAVFALNFGKGSKWIPGAIIKVLSPRNFDVQVGDVMWKRHQDQLRPRQITMNTLQQGKEDQGKAGSYRNYGSPSTCIRYTTWRDSWP
ncbi:hypothetical protein ACOMHN_042148 [Nucella lapillus]